MTVIEMNIEIVYYQSPLGALEIRSTGSAISDVLFVNSWKGAKINEAELNFTKPKTPVIKGCIKQLDEYFAGKRTEFTVHTSQVGTEFQQTVWAELCKIPYGRTISYMGLSKRIGNVKAIRAVGTANGNNSICIIVPCHRVIGSNGDLVGYGGDLWRKKWLLEHEGKVANGVQTLF
ncbi:MAG: methylated-DNA--[protein]-cysteine S-methyltransferase [Ferruginibacter sp.]